MTSKAAFVPPGLSKEEILAAEIRPPFDPGVVVLWCRMRKPFQAAPELIAVDGRLLPLRSPQIIAGA